MANGLIMAIIWVHIVAVNEDLIMVTAISMVNNGQQLTMGNTYK